MSLDEHGRVVGSDIATQAKNAFESLRRVLAEAGASMADVVKHNVYLHCDGDQAAVSKFMNELDAVRLTYFSAPGPTTTETFVNLDREGALILVDAWAVVGEEKHLSVTARPLELGQAAAVLSRMEGRRHDLCWRSAVAWAPGTAVGCGRY